MDCLHCDEVILRLMWDEVEQTRGGRKEMIGGRWADE